MRLPFRSLRGHGRALAKLGAYTAASLAITYWLVSLIGNVDLFADRRTYQAVLPDVSGLFPRDAVKIAGVEVGVVKDISLERGRAVVSFEVDDDVTLRETTEVGIRWRNVLGQKYLYVYPGSEGRVLDGGDRIPITQALASADIGEFLNAVGPMLRALDPADVNAFNHALLEALQGGDERVRRLIDNAADLAGTLGGLDTEIGRSIENLDLVVGALAERDGAVSATVDNLATLSGTLAERNDVLEDAVVQLAHVQAQMRTLLTENRGDIDATLANLEAVAAVLSRHRDDLETTLRTLPRGLAGYHLMSRYGQWFNVRAMVTCVAGQRMCDHPPPGGETGAAAPRLSARDIVAAALAGGGS